MKFDTKSGYDNKYIFKDAQGLDSPSTEESIGYAFCNKDIYIDGTRTKLISIAIRGAGYGREWSSNFRMGKQANKEEHEGFYQAATLVKDAFKEYIVSHGINREDKVILWITGYSRAAATANVLSGSLLNGKFRDVDLNISKSNLFSYCFETPKGTSIRLAQTEKEQYDGIFNIKNPNDVVTLMAPSNPGFEFTTYGKTFVLPTQLTAPESYKEFRKEMFRQLRYIYAPTRLYSDINDDTLEREIYSVDNFKRYGVEYHVDSYTNHVSHYPISEKYPISLFWNETIDLLSSKVFQNREYYADNFQETISSLTGTVMCKDATKIFKNNFKKSVSEVWDRMLEEESGMYTVSFGMIPLGIDDFIDKINQGVALDFQKAGIEYDGKALQDFLHLAGVLLTELLKADLHYIKDFKENADMLMQPHYNQNTLAWLRTFDPNYTKFTWDYERHCTYRALKVNCPVDVEVLNQDGKQVASIVNDQVMDIENGLFACMDRNGQKVVYIPSDSPYTVHITATDSGKMNCMIEEYDMTENKVCQVDNFYDVPLQKGKEMELELDSTVEQQQVQYVMKTEGTQRPADEVLTGSKIEQSRYSVSVTTSEEQYGAAYGSGDRIKGEYAKVYAVAGEEGTFTGWYQGETCVSQELEYRFAVMEDVELEARFEEKYAEPDRDETMTDKIINACRQMQIKGVRADQIKGRKYKIIWEKEKNGILERILLLLKKDIQTEYEIQVSTSKGFEKNQTKGYTTKECMKQITLAETSKVYYIRVRTIKEYKGRKGKGKWSKSVTVKT